MPCVIGQDLVRKLPATNKDIRDRRLPGFAIRCRASGQHSYIAILGRGRVMTLGKVAVLKLPEAREAARQALADVAKGFDPMAGRRRGAPTWSAFVADTYGPWVVENRKS